MKTISKATCTAAAFHTCQPSRTPTWAHAYANCWNEGTFGLCQAELTTTITNVFLELFCFICI